MVSVKDKKNTILFLLIVFSFIALSGISWGQNKINLNNNVEANADSVEERRIIVTLRQKLKEVQRREKELDQREKELKTLRGEVEKKLNELKLLRQKVQKMLAEKKKEGKKRVKELSRIYQRMNPAKAALALNSLEQDLAVDILSQMRDRAAGKVLNYMSKEKAAEISKAFSSLESEKTEQ